MTRVNACGQTDVGQVRSHNEDCFEIDRQLDAFIVADGMGGHNHGEVASKIAVESVKEFIQHTADHDTTWPFVYDSRLRRHSNRLKTAIRIAHDRVLRAIRQDGSLLGMGTTVVGMLVKDGVAAVAHVGDSRAYLVRDGSLVLLTQDHTWVNEQVMAGYLSEEQARVHPLKNVVTRALGGESEVVVDVSEREIKSGDVYLLCSDGLTGMVEDSEIEAEATSGSSPEEMCGHLVDLANSRGGIDNITVLAVAVQDGDLELDATTQG